MKRKQHSPITIGGLGIYFSKERSFFYAPWMHDRKGTKCYAIGDVFNKNLVHVYDSETEKFLGLAKRNRIVPSPLIMNNKTGKGISNECTTAAGIC